MSKRNGTFQRRQRPGDGAVGLFPGGYAGADVALVDQASFRTGAVSQTTSLSSARSNGACYGAPHAAVCAKSGEASYAADTYKYGDGRWTSAALLPGGPRVNAAPLPFGGRAVVMGGYTLPNGVTPQTIRTSWDYTAETHVTLAALGTAVAAAATCGTLAQGYLHYSSTTWRYVEATDAMATVSAGLSTRANGMSSSGIGDGDLFGGSSSGLAGAVIATHESLPYATESAVVQESLATGRAGGACSNDQERALIAGGSTNATPTLQAVVESYNLYTNSFLPSQALGQARWNFGGGRAPSSSAPWASLPMAVSAPAEDAGAVCGGVQGSVVLDYSDRVLPVTGVAENWMTLGARRRGSSSASSNSRALTWSGRGESSLLLSCDLHVWPTRVLQLRSYEGTGRAEGAGYGDEVGAVAAGGCDGLALAPALSSADTVPYATLAASSTASLALAAARPGVAEGPGVALLAGGVTGGQLTTAIQRHDYRGAGTSLTASTLSVQYGSASASGPSDGVLAGGDNSIPSPVGNSFAFRINLGTGAGVSSTALPHATAQAGAASFKSHGVWAGGWTSGSSEISTTASMAWGTWTSAAAASLALARRQPSAVSNSPGHLPRTLPAPAVLGSLAFLYNLSGLTFIGTYAASNRATERVGLYDEAVVERRALFQALLASNGTSNGVKLFSGGGVSSATVPLALARSMDFGTEAESSLSNLASARSETTAASSSSKAYIAGGTTVLANGLGDPASALTVSTLLSYAAGTHAAGTSLGSAVLRASAIEYRDKAYSLGGRNSGGTTLTAGTTYDWETAAQVGSAPALGTGRYYAPAFSSYEKSLVVGGETAPTTMTTAVDSYVAITGVVALSETALAAAAGRQAGSAGPEYGLAQGGLADSSNFAVGGIKHTFTTGANVARNLMAVNRQLSAGASSMPGHLSSARVFPGSAGAAYGPSTPQGAAAYWAGGSLDTDNTLDYPTNQRRATVGRVGFATGISTVQAALAAPKAAPASNSSLEGSLWSGGMDATSTVATSQLLIHTTERNLAAANLPAARSRAGMGHGGNGSLAVVAGGLDGSAAATGTLYAMGWVTRAWATLSSLGGNHSRQSGWSGTDRFGYSTGGQTNVATTYRVEYALKTSAAGASLGTGRQDGGALCLDGTRVLVPGGLGTGPVHLRTVEELEETVNTWSFASSLLVTGRSEQGAASSPSLGLVAGGGPLGGLGTGRALATVESAPAATRVWTTASRLDEPRYGIGSGSSLPGWAKAPRYQFLQPTGERTVLTSGGTPTSYTNAAYASRHKTKLSSMAWTARASMVGATSGTRGHAAATNGSRMLAAGAWAASAAATSAILGFESETEEIVANLPAASRGYAAAYGTRAWGHVVGGHTTTAGLTSAERWSWSGRAWYAGTALDVARTHPCAAASPTKAVVAGGSTDGVASVATTSAQNLETLAWAAGGALGTAAWKGHSGQVGSAAVGYVTGGAAGASSALVQRYTYASDTAAAAVSALPSARTAQAGASDPATGLLAGGAAAAGGAAVSTVDVLSVAPGWAQSSASSLASALADGAATCSHPANLV